jgi:hypothetical protein
VENYRPSALRVLDTVDLHCLRRARHAAAVQGGSFEERLLTGDDAKREVAAIWRSDLSLVMSRFEQDLLQRCFGVSADLIHYLPFLFEDAGSPEPLPTFAERMHFATIGNFLHAPNLDSFDWLQGEVWPLVRARLPTVELHVYGAYAPQSVMAHDDPASGLRVFGWTPDARAALGRARVCLAPLRFGAGLKGKILDALAAGTPVVTTAIGAEGIGAVQQAAEGVGAVQQAAEGIGAVEKAAEGIGAVQQAADGIGAVQKAAGWCGRIADDPRSIAAAAVELHESENLWQQAQQRGFEILAAEFDAEPLARLLLEKVQVCIDQLDDRRARNFTGAMLRHHHHRATEYMARWIEAKNRK